MKSQNLRISQLIEASLNNDYILVRSSYGNLYGHNCKVIAIAPVDFTNLSQPSNWISWRPCSFHEYITHKTKFVSPPKKIYPAV